MLKIKKLEVLENIDLDSKEVMGAAMNCYADSVKDSWGVTYHVEVCDMFNDSTGNYEHSTISGTGDACPQFSYFPGCGVGAAVTAAEPSLATTMK